jgi:hypothetical protein
MQKKSIRYILRAIVMLFLRAKVTPVNLQILANVMHPLCVLNSLIVRIYDLRQKVIAKLRVVEGYLYFFLI